MRGLGQADGARARIFRGALFALLGANTLYFAVAETPSKAIDAAAWLTLLVLFEIEARFDFLLSTHRRRSLLRAARLVAAVGVGAAALEYVLEDSALDAINSALWIAVVVLLETEVRFPVLVGQARLAFIACAAVLYGGLAMLVVVWAVAGLWLDAYDAALWLIAFVTLELEVVETSS